ncbi:MAG TPA: hypothetical protein VFX35_07770 [Solirubrobacterales bacterium]|nr:hypothetical protein [Solirubrobacterales bacterium]
MGMSLAAAGDAVAHSGQAVTLPAARGQHLFTRTKKWLMDWAREQGLAGMYSEATAAHPYSQKANIDLGAHETGFLLGWIPASVSNDAAEGRRGRQSAALFYTKLNDGHERPVYAPERHREIVAQTIELCELRGELADPPPQCELEERSELHVEIDTDHNLARITVHTPGADLEEAIGAERHHLFHHANLDAIYIDLPLERPATALVADHLERLGVSYSGIFPNHHCDGDVLRMQSLHRVRVKADDVAVASEHGQELLQYVIADLPQSA